jgi:hypothetical protein
MKKMRIAQVLMMVLVIGAVGWMLVPVTQVYADHHIEGVIWDLFEQRIEKVPPLLIDDMGQAIQDWHQEFIDTGAPTNYQMDVIQQDRAETLFENYIATTPESEWPAWLTGGDANAVPELPAGALVPVMGLIGFGVWIIRRKKLAKVPVSNKF